MNWCIVTFQSLVFSDISNNLLGINDDLYATKNKTKGKTRRQNKQVKVPLLWLACSWMCMILFGFFLFVFILKRSGVSFPLVAGQSTDPYFFAALASILAPLILQIIIIKILKGIVLQHSTVEIAKDVGKDIAVTITDERRL